MAFTDSSVAAPPGVKSSNVTISNDPGRIASCGVHGNGGTVGYVLAPGTDRGQYYWEITFRGAGGPGGMAGQVYGIGLATAPYNTNQFPYDVNPSDSYVLGGANAGVEPNTAVFGTDRVVIGTAGSVIKRWAGIPDGNFGRTLRIAYDAIGGNLWFGDDSVGWFGGGDPAAGITPAVSGIATASTWYPYYVMQNGGQQRWRFKEPFVSEDPWMSFVETQFPTNISFRTNGGPGFNTTIVQKGEYAEQRNANWARARRRYDVNSGARTMAEYDTISDFYHAVRGSLRGFRFKDWTDYKSCRPDQTATATDIDLDKIGDGVDANFQLEKYYTTGAATHTRLIRKPVGTGLGDSTILIAVDDITKTEGTHYNIDYSTGIVTFTAGNIPGATETVSWGGEFDVPVRFASGLDVDWFAPLHRQVQSLSLIEIKV